MAGDPQQIGKYEIVRRLGHGGMGTVYLGRDRDLDRRVAIKVLRADVFADELLERFLREARAAANLRHDNIITVYEVGQHDHQPFMAMEYVDGTPLSEVIKERQPLPLAVKLSYLEQICAGLHHAHAQGIVHRDVKPANLMVDRRGVIRILDFGIARVEGSGMTSDGALIGTLAYMSPEQMLGRPVDYRSDVFAVGSVAYELLSYRQAFPGTLSDGLLHRLPNEDPPPLQEACPDLPDEIVGIVMRALAKRPEDRFQHLEEARLAFRDVRLGIDPSLALRTILRPRGAGAGRTTQTPAGTTERRELLERRARQIAVHKDGARSALARGDMDGALAACEDALTLDPDDRDALQLLAEIERTKSRQHLESRELHERQRAVRRHMADADLKLSRGDVTGAAHTLQRALAAEPRNPEAQALLTRVREAAAATGAELPATLVPIGDDLPAPAAGDATVWREAPAGTVDGALAPARRWPLRAVAAIAAGTVALAAVALWLLADPSPATESLQGPQPTELAEATPPPAPAGAPPAAPETTTAPSGAEAPPPAPPAVEAASPPRDRPPAEDAPSPAAAAALQSQLDRVAAAFQRGDLTAALALAGSLPADDERVRALTRRMAESAHQSMRSAAESATSRDADDLAATTFTDAERARQTAEVALRRSDYVEAGAQALSAADRYRRAELEAVAAARAAAPPPTPAAPPAAAAGSAPPEAEASSGGAPAPARPAPDPPPVSALDRERDGILLALRLYQDAYRQKDVDALSRVFPSLPREERQRLERNFRDCQDYDATFINPQPLMGDDPTLATVNVRFIYTCMPRSRQAPQSFPVDEVFQLRKLGDGWIIERAGSMNSGVLR